MLIMLGMRPRALLAVAMWPANCPAGAQANCQFAAQRASPLNVDRLVDGLVRDLHLSIIWKLLAQLTRDLFRAQLLH
jgi:hypothetical protein